jgi:hypothetical protein
MEGGRAFSSSNRFYPPAFVKRTRSLLLLALLAAAYCGSLSTLETSFMFKSLAVLLPIQVGGSFYLLYLYWTGRITGTAREAARMKDEG